MTAPAAKPSHVQKSFGKFLPLYNGVVMTTPYNQPFKQPQTRILFCMLS